MEFKVKFLKFCAGRPIAILNESASNRMNIHLGERVLISKYGDSIISIVDVSKDYIRSDEIAVSQEIMDVLSVKEGDLVEVGLAEKPESTLFIKRKMD